MEAATELLGDPAGAATANAGMPPRADLSKLMPR